MGGLGLSPGDHVCGLFADHAEQGDVVAGFVADGLRANDKVLLICDEASLPDSLHRIADLGADVPGARASGQLEVLGKREAYMAKGRFEPEAVLATLDQASDAARDGGYGHLRATGDMTWALGSGADLERLVEYEAILNRHVAKGRLLGICQYDLSRFPASTMLDLLAVHPKAVLDRELVSNFYYMPPEEFLSPQRDAAMLRRWLGNLGDHRRALEARERAARAEADLRAHLELNALRRKFLNHASHELRTPLTPMLVRLRVLGLDPALTPAQRVQVDGIAQGAKRLTSLAADLLEAFRLEGEGEAFRPVRSDLAGLVADAVAECGPSAEGRGVRLRHDLQPVEAGVEPARMRRALAAVLEQAVAQAAPGSEVTIRLRVQGTEALLTLDAPRLGTHGGGDGPAGMGLPAYLCKLVVERHGGAVVADPLVPGLVREVRIPTGADGRAATRPPMGAAEAGALATAQARAPGGDAGTRPARSSLPRQP